MGSACDVTACLSHVAIGCRTKSGLMHARRMLIAFPTWD